MHATSGTGTVRGKQIHPDGSPCMPFGISPIAKSSELRRTDKEPARRRSHTRWRIPRGTARSTGDAPPTSGRDCVPTTRSPVPVPETSTSSSAKAAVEAGVETTPFVEPE